MVPFDPLDREILERALDAACAAAKELGTPTEFESDEGLEVALWRELIEIALQNGISEHETLVQLVLARPTILSLSTTEPSHSSDSS